ncbi:MAG: ester cyclase [Hyphomicrobiaceae bacterium]|nr:ester cyclase [Hyphomicrobiaceae bacterium]
MSSSIPKRPIDRPPRRSSRGDFQRNESRHPDWPQGRAGAFRLLLEMKTMMPDIRISIEDMVGEGDEVSVRWR